jgi:hypothetical protein
MTLKTLKHYPESDALISQYLTSPDHVQTVTFEYGIQLLGKRPFESFLPRAQKL